MKGFRVGVLQFHRFFVATDLKLFACYLMHFLFKLQSLTVEIKKVVQTNIQLAKSYPQQDNVRIGRDDRAIFRFTKRVLNVSGSFLKRRNE